MTIPTFHLRVNDGTKIPNIAFGTGTALVHQEDAQKILECAIANGFTHFDAAQRYKNEAVLGAAIKASGVPRSSLFVSTKFAPLQVGQTAKTALSASLEKLGLEYVDLYLVHAPSDHVGRLKEVWKVMEECKREGLAKSIGVSNFGVEHLQEILEDAEFLPCVNQLEVHPYMWDCLQPVMAFHKEHGIITSSFGGLSPLFRAPGGPLDPLIERIRARLEATRGKPVTSSQVLTKWLQQHDIVVVTTSTKADRMREYVDTGDILELTAEEMEEIESAGAERHQAFFKPTKYSFNVGASATQVRGNSQL
ncbi:NADP-dependent oxidoreductase domain-containing protein [Suillus clintonianus]|uniref:NADP-dependent oxidoreductase domain-containing protein n=1 Tax=Suillus clintonianus TaxID=1904413 RepID=UPI001B869D69|nr:NADP-dependent oxidoreductase domain-containing protein [Suillus clintonianus]KAG2134087.1 NADP-dependent oxidoreductase domain-containing protein [Suillus clintonianus]